MQYHYNRKYANISIKDILEPQQTSLQRALKNISGIAKFVINSIKGRDQRNDPTKNLNKVYHFAPDSSSYDTLKHPENGHDLSKQQIMAEKRKSKKIFYAGESSDESEGKIPVLVDNQREYINQDNSIGRQEKTEKKSRRSIQDEQNKKNEMQQKKSLEQQNSGVHLSSISEQFKKSVREHSQIVQSSPKIHNNSSLQASHKNQKSLTPQSSRQHLPPLPPKNSIAKSNKLQQMKVQSEESLSYSSSSSSKTVRNRNSLADKKSIIQTKNSKRIPEKPQDIKKRFQRYCIRKISNDSKPNKRVNEGSQEHLEPAIEMKLSEQSQMKAETNLKIEVYQQMRQKLKNLSWHPSLKADQEHKWMENYEGEDTTKNARIELAKSINCHFEERKYTNLKPELKYAITSKPMKKKYNADNMINELKETFPKTGGKEPAPAPQSQVPSSSSPSSSIVIQAASSHNTSNQASENSATPVFGSIFKNGFESKPFSFSGGLFGSKINQPKQSQQKLKQNQNKEVAQKNVQSAKNITTEKQAANNQNNVSKQALIQQAEKGERKQQAQEGKSEKNEKNADKKEEEKKIIANPFLAKSKPQGLKLDEIIQKSNFSSFNTSKDNQLTLSSTVAQADTKTNTIANGGLFTNNSTGAQTIVNKDSALLPSFELPKNNQFATPTKKDFGNKFQQVNQSQVESNPDDQSSMYDESEQENDKDSPFKLQANNTSNLLIKSPASQHQSLQIPNVNQSSSFGSNFSVPHPFAMTKQAFFNSAPKINFEDSQRMFAPQNYLNQSLFGNASDNSQHSKKNIKKNKSKDQSQVRIN